MNKEFYDKFDDNFSNRVYPSKAALVDKLKNMACNGDIMLEPRLQAYLTKKKQYKELGVEPCVPFEKEFLITPLDVKILKSFLSGNKDIYYNDTYNRMLDTENKNTKKTFPSKNIKDKRKVPEMKKYDSSCEMPQNQGMFVPDDNGRYYEKVGEWDKSKIMDSRDFPKLDGRGFDLNETKFSPRLDPQIYPGIQKYSKFESQYRIPPDPWHPNKEFTINDFTEDDFNKAPKNKKDNRNFSTYASNETPTYSSISDMDTNNKLVIPNVASRAKKNINSGEYRTESYYEKGDLRNPEIEDNLLRGMPSYRPRNRSYGYRNPEENYFSYINEEYEVEPWTRGGDSTRLANKQIAKCTQYNREIL